MYCKLRYLISTTIYYRIFSDVLLDGYPCTGRVLIQNGSVLEIVMLLVALQKVAVVASITGAFISHFARISAVRDRLWAWIEENTFPYQLAYAAGNQELTFT